MEPEDDLVDLVQSNIGTPLPFGMAPPRNPSPTPSSTFARYQESTRAASVPAPPDAGRQMSIPPAPTNLFMAAARNPPVRPEQGNNDPPSGLPPSGGAAGGSGDPGNSSSDDDSGSDSDPEPAHNASSKEWRRYARRQKKKNELRELREELLLLK